MQTELYLVRHGEPQIRNALLGRTNPELSELGWQQMLDNCAGLTDIDVMISSPLLRCALFAKHIAAQQELPLHISADFVEFDFGDWDGRSYQALHNDFPQGMHNFFIDPANNTPPNGESLADFSQRVEVALLNVLQEYQGKRIALFVHSGVIRTLIAWCLKIDYLHGVQFQRIKIEYASISHISVFAHEGEHFPQLGYTNKVVVQKQQNCQKME
ncbi:histidine phosphatase family protein [Moritella viscosa]|uniref:Histidine phosphatase family protein n=1 Tax=Moritella viscosa TaxID=80854 RepID=A0ABY1HCF4_9GAMM|nr:histidine phosphatase family protein [Moritella viscosa]SGY89400.1 Putative uncharacterized protein [Moritella viscosa]SGY97520.1 Putative uncharacterized protein [Moritella viscosa]SHO25824.1 Putative uncharacterized protein [Moritella viscosa]